MGFFTGTEKDPTIANSKCVIYFPQLLEQANLVVNGFNTSLTIPSNFFGWASEVSTLIIRYSLWQNYCTFGSMFGALDNIFSTLEGFAGAFYG